MKLSLKTFTISTFAILLLPVFVFAQNPGIPHQFYGTVSFGSGPAPDETLVEAQINGETAATCPVMNGEYGYNPILCFVTDPENNYAGDTINFFVNGLDTGETRTFENGASEKLDFSLSNVQSGTITKDADDVISTTTVAIVQETPAVIKMGDSLNIELSSSSSTNAVVNKVEKLGSDLFTGAMAVISGNNLLNGYEINITSEDVNIKVIMKYDDTGIDEDSITPYKFEEGSWVPIEPFWQDKTANTITFSISSAGTPYVVFGEPPASGGGGTTGGDTGGGSGGGGGTPPDTSAPSISNVDIDVGRTTATITWQTNESSISWIAYGTSTAYGKEMKTATYYTSHSIKIENLSLSATYHYQIKSKDSSGNIGEYTDRTFTTLAAQIKGDINDNGKVDKYDFALMMSDWGKTGLNIPSDLNNNGKVDKYDFSLLMVNWGI